MESLESLKAELARQTGTIRVLQDELSETNRGLMALSMELEQRVEERTSELREAQTELKRTNSELLMLTMELEDRVAQRTEELTRALSALRETEDRTSFALGATHIGTWDLDLTDGRFQCSPEFDRIMGHDPPGFGWTYAGFLDHVLPVDRASVEGSYKDMLEWQRDWNFECRILTQDGLTRWISVHGRIRLDESTQTRNLIGIIQDISSRKRAETHVRKLSQIYATLGRTNETIVRAADIGQLYAGVIEAALSQGQFAFAWIGLTETGSRSIRPFRPPGVTPDLSGFVIGPDVPNADGDPTVQAIREGRVVTIHDLSECENASSGIVAAVRQGLRAAAALPFRVSDGVRGALTLYAAEPGFFDGDQIQLLREMSSDISFALQKFEEEAQRRRAEAERESALEKLRKTLEGSILAIARTIEIRDPYTAGHQMRVSQLARAIAEQMNLESARIEGLGFGALIHDIGKIAVPSELLTTPRRLTLLEMELIRTHAEAGYNIMKDIEFPWPVADMILQHHERLDGSGYPRGLKGEEILTEARILAVADVVEAMSSHRPYRPGFGIDKALAHILEFRGILYDEMAVDICHVLFRQRDFVFASAF